MTRVNDNSRRDSREAQRREDARSDKVRTEKRSADSSKQFSQMMASKEQSKGQAAEQRQSMMTKTTRQGNDANKALLARQGIVSNKFSDKLHQVGKQHVSNNHESGELRGQEQTKARVGGEDRGESAQTQKMGNKGDKLAAISRDDQSQGQHGEGDGDGGHGTDSGTKDQGFQGSGAMGGGGSSMQMGQAQKAEGAAQVRIPPQVIQEIVKRVMVGVNKEGLNEFHIEFKENVLAGSFLTISAEDGKIRARFSTPDRNVRRLIKASEGELSRAFAKKGLNLDRLDVDTP